MTPSFQRRRAVHGIVASALAVLIAVPLASASAAEPAAAWPDKTVRLVVPYSPGGPTDYAARQVDVLVTAAPTAVPPVQGQRVRALAVSSEKRLPALPDVPTFTEAGLPAFKAVNWFGLAAPKGTPKHIVDTMNRLVNQVMSDPAMQENMGRQGARFRPMTVDGFNAYVWQQVDLWAGVGKRVGIKPE